VCSSDLGETFPNGVTEDEATNLLKADVTTAEQAVSRLVTVPLTPGQYDALVDFTYNLGAGSLKGSTLLRLLNASKYEDARTQLLKWVNAGGKSQPGLVTRRHAEFDIWGE
jgi:lysozyme